LIISREVITKELLAENKTQRIVRFSEEEIKLEKQKCKIGSYLKNQDFFPSFAYHR